MLHCNNFFLKPCDTKHRSPLVYIFEKNWARWCHCSHGKLSNLTSRILPLLFASLFPWNSYVLMLIMQVDFEVTGRQTQPIICGSQADWSSNLKLILQWSPFACEEELMQQVLFNSWSSLLEFYISTYCLLHKGILQKTIKIFLSCFCLFYWGWFYVFDTRIYGKSHPLSHYILIFGSLQRFWWNLSCRASDRSIISHSGYSDEAWGNDMYFLWLLI